MAGSTVLTKPFEKVDFAENSLTTVALDFRDLERSHFLNVNC